MQETEPLLAQPDINGHPNRTWYGSTANGTPLEPTKCHSQKAIVDDIQEEYVLLLRGFKYHWARLWLSRLLYLVSLGTVYLFCRWFPGVGAKLQSVKCSIDEADTICIANPFGEISVAKVSRVPLPGGKLSDVFPVKQPDLDLDLDDDPPMETISVFHFNSIKFILNPTTLRYETILNWRDPWWGYANMAQGMDSEAEINKRQIIFGENRVKVEKYPWIDLLMEELLNPIFIFQALCMVQWFSDEYELYGRFILFVSVISVILAFWETTEKEKLLEGMCQHTGIVNVKRKGVWNVIQATELVPGDVIEVGIILPTLPCDAVLISGSCIMNEGMLTGESKPVPKSAILPDELSELDFSVADPSNSRQMSRFFLFLGTKVIRASGEETVGAFHDSSDKLEALALVVRTGMNTTKGCLIRSIMYPKPETFNYIQESLSYCILLAVLSLAGALITIFRFHQEGFPWDVIKLRTGDLFSIAVPVALPATIAVGVGFSIGRLKRVGIYCLSAARVNVCGQIEVMCFDKTGTLTQEGLDILGFRCAIPGSDLGKPCRFTHILSCAQDAFDMHFYSGVSHDHVYELGSPTSDTTSPDIPKIITAMASCHSIKVLDGELIGDPVDLKMFELSEWEIEEGSSGGVGGQFTSLIVRPPGNSDFKEALKDSVKASLSPMGSPVQTSLDSQLQTMPTEIGVIRSFDFVNKLRRMSVITRRLTYDRKGVHSLRQSVSMDDLLRKPKPSKQFDVYCKGAPEVILSLCVPSSIPPDYGQLLRRYAHHGYHVIAISTKTITNISWLRLMRMRRQDVERDLQFLGFLVFENKLKPVTEYVVSTLHAAKIRQIMCTGDNILTAISVARDCGIMDSDCRVFAPHFESENRDADATIIWEDVDQDERAMSNISMQLELDPVTMRPVIAIKTVDILDPEEDDRFRPERFVEVEIREEYQLAVTGEVFAWYLEHSNKMNTFFRMLVKAQVYARMSPEQKKLLVASLQELGYCVGFCGDGANDWGALQAADVGVSLSEVEISVAAPFTSQCNSISCIVTLIREGRASLVTSFGSSKYMIVNGLIQFTSVMILYSIPTNLGNNMFPYIDLLLTVPIAIFMSESGPHELLDAKRPTTSFASKKILFSVVGQTLIQAFFQALIFYYVRFMPFYMAPRVDLPEDVFRCYENTVVFLLSTYQYLFIAIIYCDGAPYRENFWRNTRFIFTIAVLFSINLYMTLSPSEYVLETMDLISLPMHGRLFVLCFAALNLVVTSAAEIWVIPVCAKLAGWAWIEYSASRLDQDDEVVDDAGPSTWSESTRAIRREKAIRRKWRRKGKLYKIVEQDIEYY
ncbi:hypothetical protein HDU98_003347 [Podochytrium sp. JEL0797]|nr:hypothetical protein HDU98_003347 [Podochytrium sp. JEL0797]